VPEKKHVATCTNCPEASTTKTYQSGFWRMGQVQSQWETSKITCKGEVVFFFPKTISFLFSQMDQQVAGAPSKTSGFTSLANPVKQLPNICDMQPGCVSPKAK